MSDSANCPCCGSRTFLTHHLARICAYCRSEQDAAPAPSIGKWSENLHALRMETHLALEIPRPEAFGRFSTSSRGPG